MAGQDKKQQAKKEETAQPYGVLSKLRHDDKEYGEGDVIELLPSEAKELVDAKVLVSRDNARLTSAE